MPVIVVRRLALFVFIFLLVFPAPEKARGFELGLSPNQVYGLWINIHSVFTSLQNESPSNPDTVAPSETLRPLVFRDKMPSDVFEKARTVQESLATTFGLSEPPPIPSWISGYAKLEARGNDSATTPSQVFVLSSDILNSLVEKYVDVTNGGQPVSDFYGDNDISGKTPSDVYGLVDLMARRLDVTLSMGGSSPSTDGESP